VAEFVQIWFRGDRSTTRNERAIVDLSRRLLPDHFSPDPPVVKAGPDYLLGVLNPRGAEVRNDSVALGLITEGSWETVGGSQLCTC